MLKNKSGITLIQVIVTIILIVILASFAIWYSANTSTEAKLTRLYAEITSVKEACGNARTLNEINPGEYPISELFTQKVTQTWMDENHSRIGFSSGAAVEGLYLITPENAEYIELEKITREYVVDMPNDMIYMVDGFSRTDEEPLSYEYDEILRLYRDTLD